MRVSNQTPLPVQLIRNAEDGDRISSIMLGAVTCDIEIGRLVIATEQRPIELDPDLPYPHDGIWMKERAASVCVTGFVYPPTEGPATEAEASVEVGDRLVRVVAIGPRVWRKGVGDRLSMTEPRPFSRMPMTWEHAYGGRTTRPWTTTKRDGVELIVPGGESHHPHNPDGKGFYLAADRAVDQPLPMLEDPDDRLRAIDHYPEPRCFAPYSVKGGLRAKLVTDDEGNIKRHDVPRLASRAAPALTFEDIPAGTPIRVRGMRPRGEELGFDVPPVPWAVNVAVGPDATEVEPRLDAVDVDAEAATVRFLFRATFDYDLVRYEERTVTAVPREALEALRA